MKTLELFNAVVAKESNNPLVHLSDDGYIIEPNALWAKDQIASYYDAQKLSGNDLNKTFYKSWEKVQNSSRFELYVDQIKHYFSTYGSDFQEEAYYPEGIAEVPDVKLTFKVIKAYSVKEMTEKCLNMLRSGIALKEETVDCILSVLTEELEYKFSGDEGIRNKEAIVKIADDCGVLPKDTVEFLRYVLFKTTGETLLIKNNETIAAIKASDFNPEKLFASFGLENLAEVFNRFKPLFLAYKKKCPSVVNKISKLSKSNHKPLVQNPLNMVTHRILDESELHWLDNATPFAMFKALSACHSRQNGQDNFVYRIRNGKSWTTKNQLSEGQNNVMTANVALILQNLKSRFDLSGKKFYFPKEVEYALPTSEKMFVGNVPTGTKFYGERLAVGIYWENSWGANDLDLSAMNISGSKIGWNANFHDGNLTYSGDITDAPNGAVEYMHVGESCDSEYLMVNNVYCGEWDCKYKIVVGDAPRVSEKYMMDPNKVAFECVTNSVQKQTILGMLLPSVKRQCFVLLNFGKGNARVSRGTEGIEALKQQWTNPLSFKEIVMILGAEIVSCPEDADHDFSLDNLDKSSFLKIFS